MHVTNVLLLTGLLGICCLMSCGGSKNLTGTKDKAAESTALSLYEAMSMQGDFQWISGKARIKANTPDTRVSATLTLRMRRDSVIWATIDKLGFEVARVQITPDTAYVIDRLNQEYWKKPLSAFITEYGVNIAFRDLQNALAGNMISLDAANVYSEVDGENVVLQVRSRDDLVARHIVTTDVPQHVVQTDLHDLSGRTLRVENQQWTKIKGNDEFSFLRLIAFTDKEGLTEIELEFSEIAKDVKVSTPFSVPDHYERTK